jgi:hypothetical protein
MKSAMREATTPFPIGDVLVAGWGERDGEVAVFVVIGPST